MIGVVANIGVICAGIAAAFKLLDTFLRKNQKDKLTDKLTAIWLKIDESSLASIFQAPMRVFSLILDTLLGEKIFTRKALWKTAALSTCLMVVSLSIGGISVKTPFGSPPWTSFDEQFKGLAQWPNTIDQTIHNQKNLTPQTLELYTKYKNFLLGITKFNTTGYKLIYPVCTIILILLVCIVIYIVSLAISRMMVRQAMEAKTPLLMISILFFTLCLGIVAEAISFVLIGSAAYPLMGLSFGYLSYLVVASASTHILNIILLTTLLVISAGLTTLMWFLGPFWIKILAAVAILPMIGLILTLFISWVLFPFRKHIRYLLSQGLLRALEHEKGIFAFTFVTFGCLGTIAVAIAKLYSWIM
jgi:hypothetical protein